MKSPAMFERFVNSLDKSNRIFEITEIEKMDDLCFKVVVDVKSELKSMADHLPPEIEQMFGSLIAPPDKPVHAAEVAISYDPPAGIISLSVLSQTGMSKDMYGWLTTAVNNLNAPGLTLSSKRSVLSPDETTNDLLLYNSWEFGIYSDSLVTPTGLKILTTMVSGMIFRLCVETYKAVMILVQTRHEEFPSGKLNA